MILWNHQVKLYFRILTSRFKKRIYSFLLWLLFQQEFIFLKKIISLVCNRIMDIHTFGVRSADLRWKKKIERKWKFVRKNIRRKQFHSNGSKVSTVFSLRFFFFFIRKRHIIWKQRHHNDVDNDECKRLPRTK